MDIERSMDEDLNRCLGIKDQEKEETKEKPKEEAEEEKEVEAKE